jgi:hypothetical protein
MFFLTLNFFNESYFIFTAKQHTFDSFEMKKYFLFIGESYKKRDFIFQIYEFSFNFDDEKTQFSFMKRDRFTFITPTRFQFSFKLFSCLNKTKRLYVFM